jgi:gas vesicle protein
METTNGIGKVIGALVVGALTGAALGILFAPEKGCRTRRHIMEGAKDLADDFKNKMKDEADHLRKKADDLENLLKDKMDDVSNNVKQKVDEATKHHS